MGHSLHLLSSLESKGQLSVRWSATEKLKQKSPNLSIEAFYLVPPPRVELGTY